jgi:uncharacterized protein (DUF1499 family)
MKIFVVILLCLLMALFFTLYKNDANLFQAPGFAQRLSIFLTSNTAVTKDDHEFEELRTPVYKMSAEALYNRLILVGSRLGWEVAASDSENQNVNFVALSPLFLFKDDVFVQVKFIDMNKSSLYIQSASRKGRADMAANSGHIQALIRGVNE